LRVTIAYDNDNLTVRQDEPMPNLLTKTATGEICAFGGGFFGQKYGIGGALRRIGWTHNSSSFSGRAGDYLTRRGHPRGKTRRQRPQGEKMDTKKPAYKLNKRV
jgi:hypothetical protein